MSSSSIETTTTRHESGLIAGIQYTLFYVDEMLALTHRVELKIEKIEGDSVIYKPRNKRKLIGMRRLKPSMLFLRGWDLGLKIDTDFSSFAGNALLNFVGNPDEIRKKIDELNDYKQASKGIITYASEDHPNTKQMLYPELADMSHAVVQRIMSSSSQ